PSLSGIEVTRRLVGADPAVRGLLLSATGEEQDVLDAVKAGATGYLVKSTSREEVLDAGRGTAARGPRVTARLATLVPGECRRPAACPPAASGGDAPQLTERETQILRLVAKGLPYRQIGERLFLSHRTVQNHVQNTLTKLQLHNKVELVRYAIEQGLAEQDNS